MTLSEYLAGRRDQEGRVLVEHRRCGVSLGVHHVALTFTGPKDPGIVDISKSWAVRPSNGRAQYPGERGRLTAPGVTSWDAYYGTGGRNPYTVYAVVRCPCLPDAHLEKRRMDKLGELPVSFPAEKWGRPVDLPVVTI
jgi:hypothetical protein